MKKLFSIIAGITLIALIIVACKDSFNEKDFLTLQAKLKRRNDSLATVQANNTKNDWIASQVAALNTAGKLLALTVQVMEDNKPLAGVAVLVTNDNSQSSLSNTATTDANGNAIFKNIPLAGNTITISKTGYITGAIVADFGKPTAGQDYLIDGTTNAILPAGRSEAIQVEMFNNGSTGSLATIKGTVTIENDLTNSPSVADALPSGIQIMANFNTPVNVIGSSNRVSINSYTLGNFNFNGVGGVGTATVTNGAYSMTVPASAGGRQIGLIIPNITGTQRIALNGANNVDFPTGPAYQNVPTVWGPEANGDNQFIPSIPGAIGVFPAPPATGAGLASAFTFPTSVPRDLGFSSQTFPNQTKVWTSNNITYQFDRGTGNFSSSPTVTLSGGGASTQAVLKTQLTGTLTGFSSIIAGTGYSGTITLTFQYTNGAGVVVPIADYVFNNVSGSLPSTTTIDPTSPNYNLVSRTIHPGAVFNGALGVDNTVTFTTTTDVQSFSVVSSGLGGTNSAGGTPVYSSFVSGLFTTNQGVGYTSAPTISAFSGGGSPTAQPVLKILDFGLQWNIAFNNANITSPYSVLPSKIELNTPSSAAYPIVNTLTQGVLDQINAGNTLVADLTITGTTITLADPSGGALALHTSLFSAVAPTVVVTDVTPVQAKLTANAITINPLAASPAGAITSINTGGFFLGGIHGVGYNTPFAITIQPTITGAPGSGATALLSGFGHLISGEQQWNGTLAILNQGSGYLQNLNQTQSFIGFTGSTGLNVQAGQTYTNNISYGTGWHQIPVQ